MQTQTLEQRGNQILADVWREFQQEEMKHQAERDRAEKNYMSTIFEKGMRYRYWSIKAAAKAVETRFCYTTTPNALGCYLTFVERLTGVRKIRLTRMNISPHDTRREAKAWALKMYHKEKNPVSEVLA